MASNLISATILEMQFSQGCCTQKNGATQIDVFDSDLAIVTKLVNHYQVNTAGQVPGAITFHKVLDCTKLYIYSFLFLLCRCLKSTTEWQALVFQICKEMWFYFFKGHRSSQEKAFFGNCSLLLFSVCLDRNAAHLF